MALLPQSPDSGASDCHLIAAGKVDSDMVFVKHENGMAPEAGGIKEQAQMFAIWGRKYRHRENLVWARPGFSFMSSITN